MTCTNPITVKNKDGDEVKVSCGKCLSCRMRRAKDWAIKLNKEAKYTNEAVMITLTFDSSLLENDKKCKKYGGNLNFIWKIENSKKYLQKFIKRLRKTYNKHLYYYCIGEYGELNKRPHYHMILFGHNFADTRKEGWRSKSGHIQYVDENLTALWGAGRVTIQDLNSKNIVYVAQYTLKKTKDKIIDKRYKPKMTFSNRNKIGIKWIRRNHEEIRKGYLIDDDEKKYAIPKSWKEELKNRDIWLNFGDDLFKYEQKMAEKFKDKSDIEILKEAKIKEKITQLQLSNKKRDF